MYNAFRHFVIFKAGVPTVIWGGEMEEASCSASLPALYYSQHIEAPCFMHIHWLEYQCMYVKNTGLILAHPMRIIEIIAVASKEMINLDVGRSCFTIDDQSHTQLQQICKWVFVDVNKLLSFFAL